MGPPGLPFCVVKPPARASLVSMRTYRYTTATTTIVPRADARGAIAGLKEQPGKDIHTVREPDALGRPAGSRARQRAAHDWRTGLDRGIRVRPPNSGSSDRRYRGDRGGDASGKSSEVAGQVFEPDRPHKFLHVLGRRPKAKTRVTGLEAARASDMASKSVGGRKLAGGFDSRPPPLLRRGSWAAVLR